MGWGECACVGGRFRAQSVDSAQVLGSSYSGLEHANDPVFIIYCANLTFRLKGGTKKVHCIVLYLSSV